MACLETTASYIADSIAAMAPLKLLSHPRGQLPVFAVTLEDSVDTWTVFQLSERLRARGGKFPLTPCRQPVRIWLCCAL